MRSIIPSALDSPITRIQAAYQELFRDKTPDLFQQLERLLVEEAFAYSGENQVRAAALLGITRNVMRTQLKRYGLLSDTDGSEAGALHAVG